MPPPPRTSPTRRPARRRSDSSANRWLLAVVPGGQILGHGPAEGDEAVAPLGVERREEGGHLAVDGFGLQTLEVHHPARRPVAGDDEGPVVNVTLRAEPLGQPPAPGPLLAGVLVARPRAHVLEAPERLEGAGVDESGADHDVLVGE